VKVFFHKRRAVIGQSETCDTSTFTNQQRRWSYTTFNHQLSCFDLQVFHVALVKVTCTSDIHSNFQCVISF